MLSSIECYFELNGKNKHVSFIQYKCNKCDNFEEIKVVDGDYKLKKFHVHSTGNDDAPLRYICQKCNFATDQVTVNDSQIKL